MGSILSSLIMIIYFGAVITVLVYMIRLFTRFVQAVEKIADSVESSGKSKISQID